MFQILYKVHLAKSKLTEMCQTLCPDSWRNTEWRLCHLNLGLHQVNFILSSPIWPSFSCGFFLHSFYSRPIQVFFFFNNVEAVCASSGGISAFVFQAKQLVLAKQEVNSWRKLSECFRELSLSLNMSLPFCVFCWFLICCNISNKQVVPPAVGHDGMIICGAHGWIEQWACQVVESPCLSWRSICYNLKERRYYLIEGKETGLNWLLAGCRCKMKW